MCERNVPVYNNTLENHETLRGGGGGALTTQMTTTYTVNRNYCHGLARGFRMTNIRHHTPVLETYSRRGGGGFILNQT